MQDRFIFTPCHETSAEGCRARGWTGTPKYASINNIPDHYPLYFIKTNGAFIGDHNDIFNPSVRAFLFALIDDTVRRTLPSGRSRRTILSKFDTLSRSFPQFLKSACRP